MSLINSNKYSTISIMNIVESNKIQKTLLIYIEVDSLNQKEKLENSYDEFYSLARSSGIEIIDSLKFNQKIPITSSFVSKGKLEHIKNRLIDQDVDLIIINHQLSASQNRNLENFFMKRVIDKTELILDIFATRASSYIGKLQVELAQLNHLSTRLIRGWTHLERQKGGIGLRGPGETQLETDRRLIGKRIKRLNLRLDKAHKQREINRYSRKKSRNKLVALVGYTNAGKTTLFNKLTESMQLAEDKLFATLDSVTRKNKVPEHGPILFSDTVGFISDLPTQLVESFKATLDELKSADLLLHVVDISDVDHKIKVLEVNSILEELGLENIPQIIVNNKCDLICDSKLSSMAKRKHQEVFISAENEIEFENLRSFINKNLFNGIYEGWVSLDTSLGNIRSQLFDMGCVEDEKVSSNGTMFANIKIGNDELDQFIGLKGFELCHDKDILFESTKA
tara:strand:+ start:566 stop:1924 length:1359 start_codon:yes stop_codon:yes gene_type:complete